MIGIYATTDAAYPAEAVAATLATRWPQLATLPSNGAALPALPFIGGEGRPNWDDLLLLVFGAAPLPAALHAPIRRELERARAQGRASRILPVSTHAAHRRPPEPLDAVKAVHCPNPTGADGQRLAHRVGALVSLWLRGDDRRVFVSHRQADGQALATQVAAYLRDQGYNAWRDEERLDGGEIVQDEIERTIAAAHLLLLLDTPCACESEWIAREVDTAIGGFVPVVSVVLRPADPSGRDAAPGVYSTAELVSHRIAVALSPAGAVEPLDDAQLEGLLVAVEDYLGRLLRSQHALKAKVEEAFRDAGFAWEALDAQRFLFACSKYEDDTALVRLLSHCSALNPNFHWAVRALQSYNATAGQPTFNHRLFVYEPPLPTPTLKRLARDHGFDRDPMLRLLDPGRLAAFLSRYQADV